MMLYDVLKASKGLYVNDSFAMLWGKQLGGWKIAELTGTLPMTFRSDGTALINYRIYGTADGAGVQTENLCPPFNLQGKYLNGVLTPSKEFISTEIFECEPNTTYRFSCDQLLEQATFALFNETHAFINNIYRYNHTYFVINIPSSAHYVGIMGKSGPTMQVGDITNQSFTKGSTAPSTFIPYGYKLPLTLTSGTESKDTDIYIGDSKLLSSDYVDYETGKIVRNGTPQDPPLPLPAIETLKGTNTLDSTVEVGEVTIKGKIKEVE